MSESNYYEKYLKYKKKYLELKASQEAGDVLSTKEGVQDKLNKLFPYKNPECLTEDEFIYLDKYFNSGKKTIHPKTQQKLLKIYNRIFHDNMKLTSCSSCFKNNLHKVLQKLHKEYSE